MVKKRLCSGWAAAAALLMGTILAGCSSGKTIEGGESPVVPNAAISYGVGGDERGEAVNGNVPQPEPAAESTVVDLGLSVKWAAGNVGATSPEQAGLYFAWGETTGYTAEQCTSGVRTFTQNEYNAGPAASISADITLEQDAARANLGGNWRMPTKDEFQELIDNCGATWVSSYMGKGVAGRLYTSKVNGNSVFFPAAGLCNYSSVYYVGSDVYCWSASWRSSSSAWYLYFLSGSQGLYYRSRYYGHSVRGVCK